ncbi:DUF2651 family protein [Paenibacillus humicola]|uniref:DUF2651 family protein n=1 Tax=Paenibacillus humicola TaxID=3110540 RepID=UPI003B836F0D
MLLNILGYFLTKRAFLFPLTTFIAAGVWVWIAKNNSIIFWWIIYTALAILASYTSKFVRSFYLLHLLILVPKWLKPVKGES